MSRSAMMLGGLAIVLAVISLSGWSVGKLVQTRWLPGEIAMQPVTALCLVLAGVALWLRGRRADHAGTVVTALAAVVGAVAAWTLGAYAVGVRLPLDGLLFADAVVTQRDHPWPGRMAPGTAMAFLPIAGALAIGARRARWRMRLASVGVFIPALSVIGYSLDNDFFRGGGFPVALALPTSLALLLLAAGTLMLPPAAGWTAHLAGTGPGARMARAVVPIALIGPVAVAWLLNLGVELDLYGPDFRLALVAVLTAAGMTMTVVIQAGRLDRADASLRDSEGRLRKVVERAPFPIMVHAEDGEVVHVSRAWVDLTGYPATDLRHVADWTARAYGPHSARVQAHIVRLFEADGPVEEGDTEVRTADGRTLMWVFRSAPVGRDARGRRMIVSMAADLTERRETAARLTLLMREVDHRAKNALAVVQAVVRLSRADDPKTYAQAIEGRVEALARAHGLLAASGWSGVDLGCLLADELAPFGPGEAIEMGGPSVMIRAEAAQAVSMVLHELATNAAKYGALSCPGGRLRVAWRVMADGKALRLEWQEDGGPRIAGPPRHHGFGARVLHGTTQTQLRGRLTCVWRAEGLRVSVDLPADTWCGSGVRPVAPDDERRASALPPSGGSRRVMVVEDEALTALALKEVLEDAGFEVLGPVGRVQDALDLLQGTVPDAALLDINLFGETVEPVARVLAGMAVPFVFCTGYHANDLVAEMRNGRPVLHKPVNSNDLIAAVGTLLDQRQSSVSP